MTRRNPAAFAILVGGGIAGALDITYAIVFSYLRSGVAPARILKSVAGGLLGTAAFAGGASVAALGLCIHFFNALTIAAIYYVASRRLPFLTRQAVPWGIAYGFGVYWVMNLIVLPLSALHRRGSMVPIVMITGLIVHMFLIGLPIALATRKAAAIST